MAERTRSGRASIEVSRAAKKRLDDYKSALQRDLNRRASTSELLEALLSGVPLWQADAMLSAYRTQGQPRDDPEGDAGED